MIKNIIKANIHNIYNIPPLLKFNNRNIYFSFGAIKDKIQIALLQKMKPQSLKIVDESSGHSRGK